VNRPRLLVGTFNRGKIEEVRQILADSRIEVLGPEAVGVAAEPPAETGATFCENALLKARFWCEAAGLPALADDSGLTVDALDGAPGIYSSRFAGPDATDRDNLRLLLDRLKSVPEPKRTASFICCIALCRPASPPLTFNGRCQGLILSEPAGSGGFGYDPVFYYPPFGRTFAQAGREEKNRVSHRAQALAEFKNWLKNNEL